MVAVVVVWVATAGSTAYAAGLETRRAAVRPIRVGADVAVRAALAELTWVLARPALAPAPAAGPTEVDSSSDPAGPLVTALDVAASLADGVPLGLWVVNRKAHPVRASVSRTGVRVEVRF